MPQERRTDHHRKLRDPHRGGLRGWQGPPRLRGPRDHWHLPRGAYERFPRVHSTARSERDPKADQERVRRGAMSAPVLLGFFNLGPQEMIIVLIVGVLLFGRRLPEMGRFLGKGIVEFKKGVQGIEDDLGHDTGPVTARSTPEPVRPPPSPPSSRASC